METVHLAIEWWWVMGGTLCPVSTSFLNTEEKQMGCIQVIIAKYYSFLWLTFPCCYYLYKRWMWVAFWYLVQDRCWIMCRVWLAFTEDCEFNWIFFWHWMWDWLTVIILKNPLFSYFVSLVPFSLRNLKKVNAPHLTIFCWSLTIIMDQLVKNKKKDPNWIVVK